MAFSGFITVPFAICQGKGMVVDGRPLSVTVAVDRDKAAQLQKDKNTKEKKDNRNLHLAREGSKLLGGVTVYRKTAVWIFKLPKYSCNNFLYLVLLSLSICSVFPCLQ